jgi:hypothetical protein
MLRDRYATRSRGVSARTLQQASRRIAAVADFDYVASFDELFE